MSRLHIYTVHINPALPHPYEAAEFVQEGFNIKAFLFSTLWALYYRLWGMAVAMAVFNVLMFRFYSEHAFSHAALAVIDIGVHLLVGFEASEWRRAQLKRKGYLTADITSGDSPLRAELRFFDRYFAAHTGI